MVGEGRFGKIGQFAQKREGGWQKWRLRGNCNLLSEKSGEAARRNNEAKTPQSLAIQGAASFCGLYIKKGFSLTGERICGMISI